MKMSCVDVKWIEVALPQHRIWFFYDGDEHSVSVNNMEFLGTSEEGPYTIDLVNKRFWICRALVLSYATLCISFTTEFY
jgi:hypothetical protein